VASPMSQSLFMDRPRLTPRKHDHAEVLVAAHESVFGP